MLSDLGCLAKGLLFAPVFFAAGWCIWRYPAEVMNALLVVVALSIAVSVVGLVVVMFCRAIWPPVVEPLNEYEGDAQ